MLLSSGDKQLALLCYVPDDKLEKVNASEWMKATLASCKGEFVSGDGKVAVGVSVGDGKEKFPLKVRPAPPHQEEDGTDSARWLTIDCAAPPPRAPPFRSATASRQPRRPGDADGVRATAGQRLLPGGVGKLAQGEGPLPPGRR